VFLLGGVSVFAQTTSPLVPIALPVPFNPFAPPAPTLNWTTAASLDVSRTRTKAPTARLTNVSIRARAGSGANTLIAGAAVQGADSMPMLVRAVGSSLTRFGVADALRDPTLQIYSSNTLAAQASTASAGIATAAAYVGAFPLTATASATAAGDAALVGQVATGTLTAHCSSASNASGLALLEFYDGTAEASESSARFVNLSSRARVEAGEGLVVIGFVVSGEGSLTLLLRGVGASLEQFGVTDVLRDPAIELYSGNTRIAANDNWRSGDATTVGNVEDAQRAVGAFALSSPNDAALVATLPAGIYTLLVHGAAGQTGVALAEIHEVVVGDFDAAQSTNTLGLDLYRQLLPTKRGQNVIISPYSIESALAMTYAGAAGVTREEMAHVLRLPADNTSLQLAFADLRRTFEKIAADSVGLAQTRTKNGTVTAPIEWNAANRLFGQQGYPFRDSFISLMRDGFDAPLQPLDFLRNLEGSRRTINTWVEDQTKQRIKDLIPPGGLPDNTSLVLVNALYLNAPWDVPFEKSATLPRPFHPTPETSRDVATMNRTGSMGYAAEDGLTVVTLDYLGGALQFVVMLPNEGLPVDEAAAKLTPAHLARWAKLGDSGRRSVSLYLPKFTAEGVTLSLTQALKDLGMKTAFDDPQGTANFDGIVPRLPDRYLSISDVFHQTFVALDEKSTAAAAATAVVGVTTTSAGTIPVPPLVVRVDRPFLFAIQHRASGACLFFGRMIDPR
jgi:serpin B